MGRILAAIRDPAAVTDGQLGTALLFIGAGALAAMLLAGRGVDRWQERATAALLTPLGLVGVIVVLAAHYFPASPSRSSCSAQPRAPPTWRSTPPPARPSERTEAP